MRNDFTEQFEDMKKRALNCSPEKKPLQALFYIGMVNSVLKEFKEQGMGLTNTQTSAIKKFFDEMAEIGKEYIIGTYIQDFDENEAHRIDFKKLYLKQKEEIERIIQNELVKEDAEQIKFIILGRLYAMHKIFEKYEEPEATKLYYEIIG